MVQSLNLGRHGHLAFWDTQFQSVMLFGGQRAGDNYGGNKASILLNDVLIYDTRAMNQIDQIVFSEATLESRMYHCGFKIDQSIYSIGGKSMHGVLNSFVEIKYLQK